MYDFSVFGFFAVGIGRNFFPSKNPTTLLIEAFGVFSAGFLMRPFGALLFGYLGDKRGREVALTLSVIAMAVHTFIVGLRPGYQRIGIAAPVAMVLLRLVQGISVGGEYTTSIVFLVERGQQHQRGLMGAYGNFGAFAGVLAGSAVGTLVTIVLSRQEVRAWGWRIPFLLGITIGVGAYLMRRDIIRSAPVHELAPPSLVGVLTSQWRRIMQVAGFKVLDVVGFYPIFVYATTYMVHIVGIPEHNALIMNTISMTATLLMIPLFGQLSDVFGRKPLLLTSVLGTPILACPLFRLMQHRETFGLMLAGQLGFAILIPMFKGSEAAASAEAFAKGVRCSSESLQRSTGRDCADSSNLSHPTDAAWHVSLCLMGAALVSILFISTLGETARALLADWRWAQVDRVGTWWLIRK